jgi:hypothetical protein
LQGFAAFTGDLLITSQLLYQLSYTGSTKVYYSGSNGDVNLILPVGPIFISITVQFFFLMRVSCP